MKLRNNYQPNNLLFTGLNTKNKPKIANKIIYFTGKPTSEEISDIINISNKISNKRLMDHIKALSAPEMEGRGVCQPGIEKAKQYIIDKYNDCNLKPITELGLDTFCQDFEVPKFGIFSCYYNQLTYGKLDRVNYNMFGNLDKANLRHQEMGKTSNLLGMIKGSEKPDEYIIIAGHYDHLGKDASRNLYYPGANDDASGMACILELAKIMSEGTPPKKSVIFAALSAEESGGYGAIHLSNELINKGLANQVEVFDIDMIAGNAGQKVDVWDEKMPESKNMIKNVEKAAEALGIEVKINHEEDPGTDAVRFAKYKFPSIGMSWDCARKTIPKFHTTYHCIEDTVENINPEIFYKTAHLAATSGYLIANDTTPRIKTENIAKKPDAETLKKMTEIKPLKD